jgi:hypothetical protein
VGCKAFTPHLVGLAKELENKPFHLLASYNQRAKQEQAKHEIFQNGLAPLSPNVTVSMHARHTGVEGTGYVPYYLVFDHHGDLVHHHQGGPYHGGDGTEVLERVRGMLEQVPVIYMGKKPFQQHVELAQNLAKGKKLNKSLLALAAALAESPEDPELARILAGVERYKRSLFTESERLLGSDFNAGRERLATGAKDFAGTPWASDIEKLSKTVHKVQSIKLYGKAAQAFARSVSQLNELKPVQGNGCKVINPLDKRFRQSNRKELDKIIVNLKELRDQGHSSPAGKLSVQLLALLQ